MATNKHATVFKQGVVASIAVSGAVLSLLSGTAIAQNKPGANGSDSAIHQVVNGPEEDPNMPTLPYAPPGAPIFWSPGRGDAPQVTFQKPRSNGAYLGFNEKGSWIRNEGDRKVYVWNLKDQTLTLGAESEAGVPLNLRNPSLNMKNIIANATGHGSSGTTVASNKGKNNTPYIPPSVAGDGNAQYASGETRTGSVGPSMGASQKIDGSGAKLVGSTLTFILNSGAPASYKVARSNNPMMVNPNAPKPTGPNDVSGQWIAEDPKVKDKFTLIFVDGRTGNVSGQEFSGPVAEAMKKMAGVNP